MPSLPDNKESCNSHLAALVAINIVTQVLDEAEDILNAAHDSGQSWRYIWHQKKENVEFYENAKVFEVFDSKINDNDTNICDIIENDNIIITSTPQKKIDYTPKAYNENSFIGQGDEDIKMRNTDLRSPSMLINCLFDMSEVAPVDEIEVNEELQDDLDSRDFISKTVAKLVESYVNLALNAVCGEIIIPEQEIAESNEGSNHSSYSLLTDALASDDIENDNETCFIGKMKSEDSNKMVNDEDSEEITKKEIDLYEKTFLTLNRDYEKYSEEEDFVSDGKNFTMQDVELLPSKSFENVTSLPESTHIGVKKEEQSMAVEGTHKNSLVKRCRLQGAKLMSRLRNWWWKQRLIGRRKGCRSGICPLSPKTRNLAASLLDHSKIRSPSPTPTVAWKFNTVNEALIHSYNMKQFDLEINSSDLVEKDLLEKEVFRQ